MLQAKVVGMFPDKPKTYRPLQRKFVYSQNFYCETSISPYLSQKPDNARNLSNCLTVTQKDIVPTRSSKVKDEEKGKVITIPSETTSKKKPTTQKPAASAKIVSLKESTDISANPSSCSKAEPRRGAEEKVQSARRCAIVRASSRGLLQVRENDPSIKEKAGEATNNPLILKSSETYASPRPKYTTKSPFMRLHARNRLAHSYDRNNLNTFSVSSKILRKTGKTEHPASVGSSDQNSYGTFRSDSVNTNVSGGFRFKQRINISSPSVSRQRSIVTENARSKSSAGHNVTFNSVHALRQTKSARPHRCSSHTGNDLGCLLDQQTVARLAARIEGHVIENNGQNLQAALTPLCLQARAQVVNFRADPSASSSPFFRACQLTRHPLVEWMLRECQPDLEQTGVFLQPGDATLYQVTPLWYASATGNLDLVRLLTSFGADVNARTETGSTAVRAACCTGQDGVVQYLVAHGADLHVRTLHGVTTLMSSVHSLSLTKFTLHHGVSVNVADEQGNTALHYAAEAGHPEVTRLLVETGADASVVNKAGCSPIQGAAENRHQEVTEYLIQTVSPTLKDIIDAYYILGAMTIMVGGDSPSGLACWHRALTLANINDRASSASTSSPGAPPQSPVSSSSMSSSPRRVTVAQRASHSAQSKQRRYQSVLEKEFGIEEITTTRDLAFIASDHDALCMQALLVYERIRGASHENLVSLIMYRGAMCADGGNYTAAAHFWIVAYDLQLQKCESELLDVLSPRICRNLKFLCRVLYHLGRNGSTGSTKTARIDEERFSKLFGMTCSHILKVIHKPISYFETETKSLDFLLTALMTFFCAYLQMFPYSERGVQFWIHLREMVRVNPKDSESKTLLRMCLDRDRFLPYTEVLRFDQEAPGSSRRFPWLCRSMMEILLLLGADPLGRDRYGETVLHAVVRALNEEPTGGDIDTDTVAMLLKHGAHADQVNRAKVTPFDLLPPSEVGVRRLLQSKITLQCLAARVIVSHHIQYIGEIPTSLYSFVELHAS
ncbi:hypothetical protein EGW08_012065 [Elysia chlorotica]|uniref:Protein fem-1 homolog B n=1 Tax=Elysia chlorotica TaxID=188477 RepID=A0A3S0ZKY8_ELYCH|nr:hypothetical protein EGW08_012065 [Elysia chlorotica]